MLKAEDGGQEGVAINSCFLKRMREAEAVDEAKGKHHEWSPATEAVAKQTLHRDEGDAQSDGDLDHARWH